MSSVKRENTVLLRERLGELYLSYDFEHIDSDPVQFPHRFTKSSDIEVVAFIAAALSYGNVASIKKNLERIFWVLGPNPYERLLSIEPAELFAALEGFKHRFTTARHILWLLTLTREALRKHGSLKNLFIEGHSADLANIKQPLVRFVDQLVTQDGRPAYESVKQAQEDGALFLLPSPRGGGACKRLNLFLRWMVRSADPIDFGLWKEVNPSQLVIPLDTHVARLARYLGMTKRKTSDWKTAEEITAELRRLDPIDPLKYDFSLTRLGILKDCDSREKRSRCGECTLADICSKGQTIS